MTHDRFDRMAAKDPDVRLEGPNLLHDGYRRLEGWSVTLDGGARGQVRQEREVLRGGPCVAVVAVDISRDELVLIRQFRLPAQLATGEGDLVEIVAGRVEPGEDLETAARRELEEETGLKAKRLVRLLAFLPTPGIVDEHATVFLASVEAGTLPDQAGAPGERELTRPFALPLDEAISALADTRARNAYLLIALQWLALNRDNLFDLLSTDGPA